MQKDKKAVFNQYLECAEPKHWPKYTTDKFDEISFLFETKVFAKRKQARMAQLEARRQAPYGTSNLSSNPV